jgi:hypothetical protein
VIPTSQLDRRRITGAELAEHIAALHTQHLVASTVPTFFATQRKVSGRNGGKGEQLGNHLNHPASTRMKTKNMIAPSTKQPTQNQKYKGQHL